MRILYNDNRELSTQEIIDCDKENLGCDGGQP